MSLENAVRYELVNDKRHHLPFKPCRYAEGGSYDMPGISNSSIFVVKTKQIENHYCHFAFRKRHGGGMIWFVLHRRT